MTSTRDISQHHCYHSNTTSLYTAQPTHKKIFCKERWYIANFCTSSNALRGALSLLGLKAVTISTLVYRVYTDSLDVTSKKNGGKSTSRANKKSYNYVLYTKDVKGNYKSSKNRRELSPILNHYDY